MSKEKEENIVLERAKVSDLVKTVVEPSEAELTQVEEILKSPEAEDAKKKELTKTLEYVDKNIMKPTDGGSSIKHKDKKDLKEQVRQNSQPELNQERTQSEERGDKEISREDR